MVRSGQGKFRQATSKGYSQTGEHKQLSNKNPGWYNTKRQTDIKLNVFKLESLLNPVMQHTQSTGNARMHNFIILSAFPLSCLMVACAL
jgi:hypothetical protein